MPLPNNFSAFEHLQSVFSQAFNRKIREEFSDLTDDDLEISTSRGSLKTACMIQDNDSADMMLLRAMFYFFVVRSGEDLNPPIYGIPVDLFQSEVKFKPQIKLYFREDLDEVETGYQPVKSELTFRLASHNYDTISPTEANSLARKIATELGSGSGYRWHKGRLKVSYRKPEHGYQMVVTAYSESEARDVINKCLDIQNRSIDESCLTVSTKAQNPPTIPPNEFIYGKTRRLPRERPVAWVRFQWAELHVWGLPKPVVLVDRSGRKPNPLVAI